MAPTELKFEDTEEDIEVPTVLELLGNCRATPGATNPALITPAPTAKVIIPLDR